MINSRGVNSHMIPTSGLPAAFAALAYSRQFGMILVKYPAGSPAAESFCLVPQGWFIIVPGP
jgi:hypothetical protein